MKKLAALELTKTDTELGVGFTMKLCKLDPCLIQVMPARSGRYSENINSFH